MSDTVNVLLTYFHPTFLWSILSDFLFGESANGSLVKLIIIVGITYTLVSWVIDIRHWGISEPWKRHQDY